MGYPIYCEQPLFDQYFEPLNTVSNLFFMVAGIWLLAHHKQESSKSWQVIYLSIMLIFIGMGSFAWHLIRNDFTLLIDSVPIALFVFPYLWFYLNRRGYSFMETLFLFSGIFLYIPLLSKFGDGLHQTHWLGNGGLEYMLTISYFGLIQIYHFLRRRKFDTKSFMIISLFTVSLFFRQIDLWSCENLGFGTHFIWHFFNATVLYLFVRLLINIPSKNEFSGKTIP